MPSSITLCFIGRSPGVLILIYAARCICFKHSSDLISNLSKDLHLLFICSSRMSRVLKSPMVAVYLTWEDWARLISVAANGDDGLDRFIEKFIQVL